MIDIIVDDHHSSAYFWQELINQAKGMGKCGLFSTTQWSSGKQTHTPALSPLSCLLKENMWCSVLFQGKWKHTHTHCDAQESRQVRHVVTLNAVSFPYIYHIPLLHATTWGRSKWLDSCLLSTDTTHSFLPWHPLKKINHYSGHAAWACLTCDLWPQSMTRICLCCQHQIPRKLSCSGGWTWPCPPLPQ